MNLCQVQVTAILTKKCMWTSVRKCNSDYTCVSWLQHVLHCVKCVITDMSVSDSRRFFFCFFFMFWGFICLQRLECRMYLWWKISLEVSVVISAKSGISADGGCFLCSCPWTIFMLPEEVKLVFSVYRLAKGLPSADLWAEKLFFCIWDCVEYLRAEILVGDLVRTSCSSENFWQSELFFG